MGQHYQQQAQLNGRLLNQLGVSGAINHTDLLALQRSLNAQAFLTQQQQQQNQQQHLNLSNLNGQFNQNNLAQSILNSQNNLLQAALQQQQQQQQQQGQPILYRTQNGTLINQLQLNSINGANGSVVAAALAQQNANSNPHRYLRPQLNANNLQFGLSSISSNSPVSLATTLSSSSPSISSPGNASTTSNTNSTSSPVNSSNSNVISSGSTQQQSQQRSLNNNSHLSGLSAAYS